MKIAQFTLALMLAVVSAAAQSTPEWIWHPNNGAASKDNEVRFFRKVLPLTAAPKKALLNVAADNAFVAFVNGQKVGEANGWNQFRRFDVTKHLKAGDNVIALQGENEGGIAAIIADLEITGNDDKKTRVVSDSSWKTGTKADAGWQSAVAQPADWVSAKSIGKLGVQPWGVIAAAGAAGGGRQQSSGGKPATPAESLTVFDGFKVELLHSAQAGEGSWVSMTIDHKGRLIISPQGKEPMLRITLDAKGQIAKKEPISVPVNAAMGLLYAFDSLYVNGQGPDGYHLYRVTDSNNDDTLDKVELLRKWKGGPGEHGAHGIVLGRDQKLYVVNGNFVDVPDDIVATSQHKNYADDVLLGRMEDGNGFGAGRKPPGGYVVRLDKDGKNAELLAAGQRNTYDIAFNEEGELFGFDSDMEWDWGSPWYRPTRAYQIVSGADHGFREGSAKWPEYYEDSLPATVNIGIGSPTGVLVPSDAKVPDEFRRAVWMMDWSYGRIVAVHLKADGSGYTGSFDTVVKGKPLNVTDMVVGPDGAVYFATGGRGTQSGLYRVSYTRDYPMIKRAPDTAAENARKLRRELETFHGRQDPKAVAAVWPHLGSSDRFLRYAARVALESQPVAEWKDKAVSETNPQAGLTALLALARVGGSAAQADVLNALKKFPTASLPEAQQLLKLRVIELSFIRQGRPADDLAKLAVEKLSPLYPGKSWPFNRELSQILIYLDAPGVVSRTLDLVAKAQTQEEQLHYISALRKAKTWKLDERRRYLSWFQNRNAGQDAGATYPAGGNYFISATSKHPAEFEQWFTDVGIKAGNGASYNNFIKKLKKEITDGLTADERIVLGPLLGDNLADLPKPKKQHQFVSDWKMADFAGLLDGPSKARNYESGREAYLAAQCIQCHRLNNEGGGVGPDLSGAGAKYSRRDLLEAILEPSKVVSDQYQNTTVTKKDGDDITGRIVEDNDTKLVLVPNPLTGETVEVKKSDVKSRAAAKLSPMPEGLASILTKEEVLDLLAYIESAGNKQHAVFKK